MNPSFFFAYFYRRLFRSCGLIKGCRLDTASFFGKILPLAVWRFSRKPMWLALDLWSLARARTFHSNLQVYLCHGNVSNGRTEIPAKVHGSDCNQVACPSSWQCLRKREFWMSKSEYKNGILKRNTPNDEQRKAGTASPRNKCASEGTDKCLSSARHFRRTLVGIAHQQTTLYVSPFDRGRRERHGMLDA